MSNSAEVSFFELDKLTAAAVMSEGAQGGPALRFSGVLDHTLTFDDADDEYATFFAVASRRGNVVVTVQYTTAGSETFTVEPGRPLFYYSLDNDSFSASPTIAPVDTDAEVDVLAFTTDIPIDPPDPAFLILNAGSGLTISEFTGKITAWRDTREVSLAPEDFDWFSGDGATYVASDTDFGGRPSVSFPDTSFFTYSGGDGSLWSFMKGGSDFTVMSIMYVADNAEQEGDYCGLWNTSSGSARGFRAMVDPAFRFYNLIRAGGGSAQTEDEEIGPKAVVVIWRFDASSDELRMYWQGVWHGPYTLTDSSGSTDGSVLQVGLGLDASDASYYMDGKIADFRVYNRLLSEDEHNAYINTAMSDYGIDDTSVQGFPWLDDVVNMHRANRGLTWSNEEQTTLSTWKDTRPECDDDCRAFVPGAFASPTVASDATLNGHPAFQLDGVDDGLTNSFLNTSGDHLAGSGMTITFIFYFVETNEPSPLMAMGDYNAGSLQGTTIFYGHGSAAVGQLTYETDNNADDDVIFDTGTDWDPSDPLAVVLRGDGSSYWIDELNLATGETYSVTGSYGGTESTSASASVYLASFPSGAFNYLEGAIAEMTTRDSKVSNATVETFFTYARNRYGSSS